MQVSELIKKLQKVDQDAHVVIMGEVINNVEIQPGKIDIGYSSPIFIRNPYGKEKALMFTRLTEFADGEMYEAPI